MNKEIREDINRTIQYSLTYGIILKNEEIYQMLVGNRRWKKEAVIREARQINKNQRKIETIKAANANKKINAAKRVVETMPFKKWILLVGLTGSVSSGYANREDDIDIVIITKRNRMWLVRLLLKTWLMLNKIPHRRWGREERKDDYCFNLWLDTRGLSVPKNRRGLNSSWDLLQVKILYEQKECYKNWLIENGWVKKYMKTPDLNKVGDGRAMLVDDRGCRVIDFLNYYAFVFQLWFMSKKRRLESIDLHFAYFHNN